jgi:hypothetical protein
MLTGRDQDRGKGIVIMEEAIKVSARASLGVIGFWFRQQGIWSMSEERVKIKQKVHTYRANEKLLDCFVNILAGGRGLTRRTCASDLTVQCNKRLVATAAPSNRRFAIR